MDPIKKQNIKRRSHRSRKRGLGRLLTFYLFIVLGATLLVIGLYYSFSSSDDLGNLITFLLNLVKPTNNPDGVVVLLKPGTLNLWIYEVPACLALIILNLYARKYRLFTYLSSNIIAIYLIVINTKLWVANFISRVDYFPSFQISLLYLFLILLLFLITAIRHRKSVILVITCIYFYITVLLYVATFSMLNYLLLFVLLFNIVIFYLGRIIDHPYLNFINFSFGTCFYSLIFLVKFVVNSKPDFLFEFFTFGTLTYLLFYAIARYSAYSGEKPISKWMQFIFTWFNLLFFLGTISFLIKKYYGLDYIWIFALALFLFNLISIKLIKRYESAVWTQQQYFVVLFLAALVMPLLLHLNMAFLIIAELSIIMLVLAKDYKSRVAMQVSLLSIVVMTGIYVSFWINYYLPALFPEEILPDMSLIWNGILSGIMMTLVLMANLGLLEHVKISVSKEWFSNSIYNRLIRILLLFSLFLTFGWIVSSLVGIFTGELFYSLIGWFISGSIFFIMILYYYANKKSAFKRPLQNIGFTFAILYPIPLHWNMTIFLERLVINGEMNMAVFAIHYIALILLVILMIITFLPIYLKNSKKIIIKQGIQLLTISIIYFLFCTEYDTLSVLITAIQKGSINNQSIGDELLSYNKHLPYSVIMWLLSSLLFIFSIFQHNRFLRGTSIILFIGILIKLFSYDFDTLSQGERGMVLFILGLSLIGVAYLYSYLIRTESKLKMLAQNAAKKEQQASSN